MNLVSMNDHSSGEMQMIIETNFRVYVYTDSALHVALLRLFIDVQVFIYFKKKKKKKYIFFKSLSL